jgi:hypothetical protein
MASAEVFVRIVKLLVRIVFDRLSPRGVNLPLSGWQADSAYNRGITIQERQLK